MNVLTRQMCLGLVLLFSMVFSSLSFAANLTEDWVKYKKDREESTMQVLKALEGDLNAWDTKAMQAGLTKLKALKPEVGEVKQFHAKSVEVIDQLIKKIALTQAAIKKSVAKDVQKATKDLSAYMEKEMPAMDKRESELDKKTGQEKQTFGPKSDESASEPVSE